MNKVLVTGAGGFIGSNLVEELVKKGIQVRAFIHYNSRNSWGNLELLPSKILNEVEIFTGNIEDPFSVKKAVKNCDTVFHLAALIGIPYSYIAPESYVNTNVKGTLNIMQACLDQNVEKIVHTSTSEAYGTAIYTPIDEEHPLQGQSPYSASKIGADKIAESYHLSFDLPVATIRPFNTYGPMQSARAIIPTIISQALTTKANKIKLGSLNPVRDLNFVKDTVNGFIKIAENENSIGELINIGFGEGIPIGKLADKIINFINPKIKIISDEKRIRPDKSEVMKLICNNEKAEKLVNWKPEYTLEQGLKETIEFVKEHINLYKPEIYNV
ncbi:MAG: SDR family NAD(P)-dependent oxidoreductase [Candidatus Marinimicrobia bacterium]|nr:SDR family NAD(P)-dependent oxidoreductase [Candidatus Neomarinimicrobiota bacterium]